MIVCTIRFAFIIIELRYWYHLLWWAAKWNFCSRLIFLSIINWSWLQSVVAGLHYTSRISACLYAMAAFTIKSKLSLTACIFSMLQ